MKEQDDIKGNVWLYIAIIIIFMAIVLIAGLLIFYFTFVKLDLNQ